MSLRVNPSLDSTFLTFYPSGLSQTCPCLQHLLQPDLFQPRPQLSLTMEQGPCRQDKLSTRNPQSSAMFLYPEQEG